MVRALLVGIGVTSLGAYGLGPLAARLSSSPAVLSTLDNLWFFSGALAAAWIAPRLKVLVGTATVCVIALAAPLVTWAIRPAASSELGVWGGIFAWLWAGAIPAVLGAAVGWSLSRRRNRSVSETSRGTVRP